MCRGFNNPIHPKISIHSLHTPLYTFPLVLTRRLSCLGFTITTPSRAQLHIAPSTAAYWKSYCNCCIWEHTTVCSVCACALCWLPNLTSELRVPSPHNFQTSTRKQVTRIEKLSAGFFVLDTKFSQLIYKEEYNNKREECQITLREWKGRLTKAANLL